MRNSQRLDNNWLWQYYLENGGKIKNKEEKKQKTVSKDDNEDTKLFSNHSANLIEDWQDLEEDNIWK